VNANFNRDNNHFPLFMKSALRKPIQRESTMKSIVSGLALAVAVSCFVATWTAHEGRAVAAQQPDTKEQKIRRAMSAGPVSITKGAKIVETDEKGKTVVLRDGSNGWTCFAGQPGIVADNTECDDQAAMQWNADWDAHKPKPTNTIPGIGYMFAGGTDWSATEPYATSGTPIKEPPHWMLFWPFDPKETGLSDKPKDTGTWIMWAGTPYAHLMINQKP
jgi:hypothetical protein